MPHRAPGCMNLESPTIEGANRLLAFHGGSARRLPSSRTGSGWAPPAAASSPRSSSAVCRPTQARTSRPNRATATAMRPTGLAEACPASHPIPVLCCGYGNARVRVVLMVTDRDRAIVDWIGRLGAAGATEVMARFGMGRTATYRRLAALVDQGVLATERLLYGQPALYVATREGLQWARLARLEPCRWAWRPHDTSPCAPGSPWCWSAPNRHIGCGVSARSVWPSSTRGVRWPARSWAGRRIGVRGCAAPTSSSCPATKTAAGRSP